MFISPGMGLHWVARARVCWATQVVCVWVGIAGGLGGVGWWVSTVVRCHFIRGSLAYVVLFTGGVSSVLRLIGGQAFPLSCALYMLSLRSWVLGLRFLPRIPLISLHFTLWPLPSRDIWEGAHASGVVCPVADPTVVGGYQGSPLSELGAVVGSFC